MSNATSPLTESMYYILLSVLEPLHGYGIMQKTATLSHGRVQLAAGTLYGALQKLEQRGWISALKAPLTPQRKKEYQLTTAGKQVLVQELARLEELVTNGKHLILEGSAEA